MLKNFRHSSFPAALTGPVASTVALDYDVRLRRSTGAIAAGFRGISLQKGTSPTNGPPGPSARFKSITRKNSRQSPRDSSKLTAYRSARFTPVWGYPWLAVNRFVRG